MPQLYCIDNNELSALLELDKPFRAKIVRSFLDRGVTDFEKMTSLPKDLRERLSSLYPSALSSTVEDRFDGTDAVKLALRLEDGALIECVRLSDGNGRYTACLSSQVGCAMGCAFCATGTMGFTRNLKAGEIVEEYIHLEKLGEHITHIVFMGMGEPLNNFTEVMSAITALHREDGINISYRRITISTCGLVPGIRRLTELNLPVKLAVSLVSASDELRSSIMKVNRNYPLGELRKALTAFQKKNGKRITLEYCLLGGLNTTKGSAAELRSFIKGMDVLVNLIRWNPIPSLPFRTPEEREVRVFTSELQRLGISYTIRRSKGREEKAACGMLATEHAHKMSQPISNKMTKDRLNRDSYN